MASTCNNQTCVVTGATGFVGSRVAHHLRRQGFLVKTWGRQPVEGNQTTFFRLGQDVDREHLKGVHILVHCAYDFQARGWNAIRDSNVKGSQKLFRAAKESGVEKVVFVSSLSAFPGCRSLYGRAKLAIEAYAAEAAAWTIRPGLVYGNDPGGVFGRLVDQVRSSSVVPLLSGGIQSQYLAHEEDLAGLVLGCLEGRVPTTQQPISVADERPWHLREILDEIANSMGKRLRFVPVPWQIIWFALKTLETLGISSKFRSDSLIGMVFQNPSPSFALMKSLGFSCRPFGISPGMLKRDPAL